MTSTAREVLQVAKVDNFHFCPPCGNALDGGERVAGNRPFGRFGFSPGAMTETAERTARGSEVTSSDLDSVFLMPGAGGSDSAKAVHDPPIGGS
jgi:hypothetical protein